MIELPKRGEQTRTCSWCGARFFHAWTWTIPERELIQHVAEAHPEHHQDLLNTLAQRRGFQSATATGPIPLAENT